MGQKPLPIYCWCSLIPLLQNLEQHLADFQKLLIYESGKRSKKKLELLFRISHTNRAKIGKLVNTIFLVLDVLTPLYWWFSADVWYNIIVSYLQGGETREGGRVPRAAPLLLGPALSRQATAALLGQWCPLFPFVCLCLCILLSLFYCYCAFVFVFMFLLLFLCLWVCVFVYWHLTSSV